MRRGCGEPAPRAEVAQPTGRGTGPWRHQGNGSCDRAFLAGSTWPLMLHFSPFLLSSPHDLHELLNRSPHLQNGSTTAPTSQGCSNFQ